MPRRASWLLALVLLTLIGCASNQSTNDPPEEPPRPARDVGLTDSINIADARSVKSHQFKGSNDVAVARVGDFVGGHDMHRLAHVVRGGSGSWVSYQLRVAPGKSTLVEIEEIDGRETDVRAYDVFIDGVKVLLRTWQGCGAGPVHYFVVAPPTMNDHATIRLMSRLPARFAISRIWAYADFDRYFAASGMAAPYYLAPTVPLKWNDYDRDVERVRRIRISMGGSSLREIKPAWTTWIAYAQLSDRELARRIDYALRIARELSIPVQICFDSWWANTPTGADGQGGFWTDVKYQQVVLNRTLGQMQLSIPNQWSNTPWLSVNQGDLNSFKARRLTTAATTLAERYEKLAAQGKADLILAINLDNEPVYWASGSAGLGPDLLEADFNSASIANAKRDGVALDPSDGLSRSERLWLWRNLLGYNAMAASTVADALQQASDLAPGEGESESPLIRFRNREPTTGESEAALSPALSRIAGRGSQEFAPVDLLRNNVYTQAMMMALPANQYPMMSAAYPLWESAAPAACRVGGEWNAGSRATIEATLHQLPLGRCAQVNAECENRAENMLGVMPGYALGQRFYALYNYPLDRMNVAVSELTDLERPFTLPVYGRVLADYTFVGESWKYQVQARSGLATGLLGNTSMIAAYPVSNQAPAYLVYKLQSPSPGGFDGLTLELAGRAKNFTRDDSAVCIRVLAAPENAPSDLREVAQISDAGNLDEIHRIDLSAVARGNGAIVVRIELAAPGVDQKMLSWCAIHHVRFTLPWVNEPVEQKTSLAESRQRHLLVSWRRDAELMLEALSRANLESADAQLAYWLGEYARSYSIACRALAERARVTLDPPYASRVKEAAPDQPRTIAGVFAATAAGGTSLSIYADSGVIDDLLINDRTKIARNGATVATLADFRRGDDIVAKVDPTSGDAIEVQGGAAELVGVVAEFQPLSPMQMPTIKLTGEAKPHVIDLGAPLHLADGDTTLKSLPCGSIKLIAGDKVALRINPKTGRVFELWRVAANR